MARSSSFPPWQSGRGDSLPASFICEKEIDEGGQGSIIIETPREGFIVAQVVFPSLDDVPLLDVRGMDWSAGLRC